MLAAFFVRKGRKERKGSKDCGWSTGLDGIRRARLVLPLFFASFADKCFFSVTCDMFGESPGRPCRCAYSRKEYPLKIKDMRDVL
jgi:hypothetical protein